ncbi:MAG TPA: CxxC-x17-CxxC domain-containing protein [Candidatus Bathyarchaeia archaeon]|nr:CxxC-x17-CxxC domain-containing protein [Candidatus Bathyarchaeia archaeon]
MKRFNQDDRSGPRRDFDRRDSGRRSFDGYRREREMHKAVCSSCGKDCEVPFEPTSGKPVYCNDCFKKSSAGAGARRPSFERRYESRPQDNKQFEIINQKLDKIIKILETCCPVKQEKEAPAKPGEITVFTQKEPKKEAKTPKKKTPETKK